MSVRRRARDADRLSRALLCTQSRPPATGALGDRAAVHQTRQDPEADAAGDHRRSADQQERGLSRTGLGELVLTLALLDRLVADTVGVGVVRARDAVEVDGARVGVTAGGRAGGVATTDSRVAAADSSVTATNRRVATADSRVTATNRRVTATNRRVTATNRSVATADSSVTATNRSVTATNRRVATADSRVTATNRSVATADSRVTATNRSVTATNRSVATADSRVTATNRRVATADSRVTATNRRVATTSSIATTSRVTATSSIATTSRVTATGHVGTAGGVTALVVSLDTQADVETVLVGLGRGRDPTDVDTDADGLRRAGSGQRGTRGNYRTGGYPRDADSRLLGHLLLPPVAVLVNGAAICGLTVLPGVALSACRATWCRSQAALPRPHPSQTYACCPSTLSRVKDYVKPVPCNVHRFASS
ncbi:hypothetical protein ACFYRJ_14400 [Streptomyces sp. NPDC005531]|uniref:hypothetical protein n=1 Tax=Streptomyces sp. NPDC005531 TaxID=3364722 RepID=UPI0036AAC670